MQPKPLLPKPSHSSVQAAGRDCRNPPSPFAMCVSAELVPLILCALKRLPSAHSALGLSMRPDRISQLTAPQHSLPTRTPSPAPRPTVWFIEEGSNVSAASDGRRHHRT
uniref:Uncharacterized protein n=1 Tax=Arundo donax TaxID=35708 RepID=A0A0A9F8T9_ARUDO